MYKGVLINPLIIRRCARWDMSPCLSGWHICGQKDRPLQHIEAERLTRLLKQVACIKHHIEIVEQDGVSLVVRMETRLKREERMAFIQLLQSELGTPLI